MLTQDSIKELKRHAKEIRKHVIRSITAAGSGHPGGSLSAVELMTALFFHKIKHNPKEPKWEERDRVILSKGHAAPLLYATLAEAGYFSKEELASLRKLGSRLQGHPRSDLAPWVEVSTGSLGQGLSIGVGMALAGKLDGKPHRMYVILGDGECDEGQVWEAAMSAAHYKLDNITAIVDRNGLQIDGSTEDVMALEPFADKWRAFGWHVIEIDGHDLPAIIDALDMAEKIKDKPAVIIANTVKGKGVSFMEGRLQFHGMPPTKEQGKAALDELEGGTE